MKESVGELKTAGHIYTSGFLVLAHSQRHSPFVSSILSGAAGN